MSWKTTSVNMTDNNHPITPPLELLKYWEDQHFDEGENYDVMLIQAYQAGADQELEACCEWLSVPCPSYGRELRNARRPKPPSLKQQALGALYAIATGADDTREFHQDLETIKQALESLPS
jgi:hypothetical protein